MPEPPRSQILPPWLTPATHLGFSDMAWALGPNKVKLSKSQENYNWLTPAAGCWIKIHQAGGFVLFHTNEPQISCKYRLATQLKDGDSAKTNRFTAPQASPVAKIPRRPCICQVKSNSKVALNLFRYNHDIILHFVLDLLLDCGGNCLHNPWKDSWNSYKQQNRRIGVLLTNAKYQAFNQKTIHQNSKLEAGGG